MTGERDAVGDGNDLMLKLCALEKQETMICNIWDYKGELIKTIRLKRI